MMNKFEELILAMRKDLGHKDGILEKGDILRMIINDYGVMNAAREEV
ncbi:hypothetical protein [Nocardiopsis chromatogenes]|nr:hypothetical protein [Nocardiopsis chromatogenes]